MICGLMLLVAPVNHDDASAPAEADKGRSFAHSVLVVEDEEFTRSLVTEGLADAGFSVRSAPSVAAALDELATFEPHVIITDLDFGPGPSGVDLINRVVEDWPWVGIVVLTSHASVELGAGGAATLPDGVVYVVKSSVHSMSELREAVVHSLEAHQVMGSAAIDSATGQIVVTPIQAETLRLIAEGLSNAGIAKRRGTSLRSAEALVQRTLHALRIPADPDLNPRVLAVRMWQQGRIVVR